MPRVNIGDRVTIVYEDGEILPFVLGGITRQEGVLVINPVSPMGMAVHKARLGDTVICSPELADPVFAQIISLNGQAIAGPDRENARTR